MAGKPASPTSRTFTITPDPGSVLKVFPPRYRLFALFEPRHESDPEEALTTGAERGAGRHNDAFFEEPESVGLIVSAIPFWHFDPEVDARVRG